MAHVKCEEAYGKEIAKRVRELEHGATIIPAKVRVDHVIGVAGTREMGCLVRDLKVGDIMIMWRQSRVLLAIEEVPENDKLLLLRFNKMAKGATKVKSTIMWEKKKRVMVRRPQENL